jgi:predicted enzyme related to lactoylglutathione lyase
VNAFVCTVGVASAESSLAKAVELGAEVALPMMAVPGIGWLCYAKDPDVNVFGMMQADPTAA